MFLKAYKYQCIDSLKAIVVYYIVMVVLFLVMFLSVLIPGSGESMMSGMEIISVIFLFVVGLNSFKETFLFQLQNGVSRRTIWMALGLQALTVAVGMSLVDGILILTLKGVGQLVDSFTVESLSQQLFKIPSLPKRLLVEFLFAAAIYLFSFMVGLVITMAYYRMNKTVKIAVSVGVPASIFIGLPLLESTVTHGNITKAALKLIEWTFGYFPNPWRWSLWYVISAVLLLGICYLLIRRAIVKK